MSRPLWTKGKPQFSSCSTSVQPSALSPTAPSSHECTAPEYKDPRWPASFLSDRMQWVRLRLYSSETKNLSFMVPQRSLLSPTLYNVYMAPLAHVIRSHGINIVSYTNNPQVILSLTDNNQITRTNFTTCMSSMANLMKQNSLKLNTDKTNSWFSGTRALCGTPPGGQQNWECWTWLPQPRPHNHYLARQLQSATLCLAQIPHIYRRKTGECSFSCIPAKTWNNLPHHLRTSYLYSSYTRNWRPDSSTRSTDRPTNCSSTWIPPQVISVLHKSINHNIT